MVNSLPVTSSLQDYLEVILSLSRQNPKVRVTDIADRLNIAKASVNQALHSLKKQGLITQSHYGPVELTDKGREYAGKIRYRHEVLRFFLMEVLGVSAITAEQDACLLEHDLSNETFEKLLEFLEKGIITTRFNRELFRSDDVLDLNQENVTEERNDITLIDLKTGQSGIISSIENEKDFGGKLEQSGIRKGKEVTKVSSVFNRGPVTIKVDDNQIAVGYEKAMRIFVEVNED